MSILTGLDKLIASVAGPLVFERASLLKGGSYSIDPGTGQTLYTPDTSEVQAIEEDYKAFHRASLDIPRDQRIISILGYQTALPVSGDRISLRGVVWEIISVRRDPAGALYVCDARPVAQVTDTGPTANLLSSLPSLIADIAGPLLFSNAILFSKDVAWLDSNGQAQQQSTPHNVLALEGDYSDTHRAQSGIPDTDKRMLVLGDGLTTAPVPGDRLAIDGLLWEIQTVTRDPARALYECQSRPIGIAVAIIYATHAGRLPAITGSAEATLDFIAHAGVLPALQGVSNAAVDISAIMTSSMVALGGSAAAEVGAQTYSSGQMAPLSGQASGTVDIAAAHSGALPAVAGGSVAGVHVSGLHSGAFAPLTGSAFVDTVGVTTADHAGAFPALQGASAALVAIEAAQAGELVPMGGAGLAAVQIRATALGSFQPLTGTAQNEAETTAEAAGGFAPLQGTGEASNAVTGQSGAIMAPMSGTGLATVAIQAIQSGTFPALTGAATGAVTDPARTAEHAGAFPAIIGAALAEAAIAAAQAGSFPVMGGAGISVVDIIGAASGAFPAITGSALAEASIVGTQTATLPAITGSATGDVEAPAAGRTTPTLRSVTSSEESLTFTKPAGTVAGDILIGFWTDFGGSRTITPPAGWTAIGSTISHGGDINFRAAYKVAGGSEPSSYTATQSVGADYPQCICFAISGADTSAPVAASATSTGTSSNTSIPSVTAANDNSFLIGFIHGYETTATPPSGMTFRASEFTTFGFTQAPISAGATGAKSTGVFNDLWGSIGIVINGAPS